MKTPLWYRKLERWVEGDSSALAEPLAHRDGLVEKTSPAPDKPLGPSLIKATPQDALRQISRVLAIACCAVFTLLMLTTVALLPRFGSDTNPVVNETIRRYVENGLEEVGATNLVTNIILVYRGFDTYGESCVLFLGASAVAMLLEADRKNTSREDKRELKEYDRLDRSGNNQILRHLATVLAPIVMLYGMYILCNGHLSPGGGFAGGSILGGALILCENAFGYERVRKFFNRKVSTAIRVAALLLYAVLICYTIFVGANGLENRIPLGTPGSFLSAGIILPINVAVGLVVACTMYSFYAYFGRGEL